MNSGTMTCSWVAGKLYVNVLTGTITLEQLNIDYLIISPGATAKLAPTTTAKNIDTAPTGKVILLTESSK